MRSELSSILDVGKMNSGSKQDTPPTRHVTKCMLLVLIL